MHVHALSDLACLYTRLPRGALLTPALCCALLSSAGSLQAASFTEFVDPNPASGNQFGASVVALSTGNVVITSPFDDAGGVDAGAVYLFDGVTGALISTLRGSTANDLVGNGGVKALSNGNYVVLSPNWDNGAIADVGAATWGSGTTGVNGAVSAANSLIGSTASDLVGIVGVVALSNGNYVVLSPSWDSGATVDAGAATWGSGTTGVSGAVSAANSLVGSAANDQVGGGSLTVLSNGNYVVQSPSWDNGAIADAGAATWGSGTAGVTGTVSAANSLVGSTAGDNVGVGVTPLSNGNYVALSPSWNRGAIADAGAATWGSGTTGVTGAVSAANSLVGSTAGDNVSGAGVTALSNGNYVVGSQNWANGAILNAGAATWGSGATGVTGAVSAANSLVGSTATDLVGGTVPALSNGNYVVLIPNWNNGAIVDAGAATWGSGTTGVTGTVSAANSLVGSAANDRVGSNLTPLSNGNYVVRSVSWDNGATVNAGAATWGSGTTGVTGAVSATNSLVGSMANDNVGSNVTALTNGNYVVSSPNWDDGAIANVGAATWGSGTVGVTGAVSGANSLVGSTAGDNIALNGVTKLSNGNYVVRSLNWDNGANANAGAATWGSGTAGVSGAVSATNSLVGSVDGSQIGSGGVTALSNGNYVVGSPLVDSGVGADVGAATWGNGTTGVVGGLTAANSLIGSTADDRVGSNVTALSNGNYVVLSTNWDNGAVVNAGAATWGGGSSGVTGAVSAANSLIGMAANAGLQALIADDAANDNFSARFLTEGGGRVRVGPPGSPVIVSAVDIPNDQGGWLRLTFNRSSRDDGNGVPPVATYGVWRLVPGAVASNAGEADPSSAHCDRLEAFATESLRALLPPGLDVRGVARRFYVTGPPMAEIAFTFPPGIWELVSTVPAVQQTQYVVAVPTISNAAANDYLVTAHTTTPSIWFRSNTANGQSVDNLAPAQPTGLTAAYSSGQTNLQWTANIEHDLGSYHLYRGASADFAPSPGNLVASPTATSYADVGPAGSYYKLSAVDVNGNESSFALITPEGTTGVDGASRVAFALEGVRPNPAKRNGLHVAFALPTGAAARLELMDVSGRRVVSREVGALGAGRHTVNLSEGRTVVSGLYWVRLTQGANRRTTRVAVMD